MARWVLLLALLLPASACGDDPADWPAGRPRIDRLVYLQQSPQDSLALQFLIEFTDSDGDLGGGEVRLRINGDEKAVLPLTDLFGSQSPPVAPDATVGDFEIVVCLKAATAKCAKSGGADRITETVEPGSQFEIGFELEDGDGNRSNDPSVTLEALE